MCFGVASYIAVKYIAKYFHSIPATHNYRLHIATKLAYMESVRSKVQLTVEAFALTLGYRESREAGAKQRQEGGLHTSSPSFPCLHTNEVSSLEYRGSREGVDSQLYRIRNIRCEMIERESEICAIDVHARTVQMLIKYIPTYIFAVLRGAGLLLCLSLIQQPLLFPDQWLLGSIRPQ